MHNQQLSKREYIGAMMLSGFLANQIQLEVYFEETKEGEKPLDKMIEASLVWADKYLNYLENET